jgi:hypothetical protein
LAIFGQEILEVEIEDESQLDDSPAAYWGIPHADMHERYIVCWVCCCIHQVLVFPIMF